MLVGILSDSHDRVGMMAAALQSLRERGAEFFIHCGDVGSEAAIDLLAGLPGAMIWGNTDWDRQALSRYAENLHVRCYGDFADLILDEKRFAITHGDNSRLMRQVLAAQQHDYLLHGHTHIRRDERSGRTRIINPGALHRARDKTVALLDTARDELSFINIRPPGPL